MGYDELSNWYKTNFNMMQFHHYSLSDIEGLIPWERHLYVTMIKEHIKAQKERKREAELAARH